MDRDIRVRPASPGDDATLTRLDYDAWRAREVRPALESPATSFFERSHGGGLGDVLVATTPEAVVGFLVVLTDREPARIAEVCVDPPFRRRRTGTALLHAAARQARARGRRTLLAPVPGTHPEARQLVRSAGFRALRSPPAGEERWALDLEGVTLLRRRSPLP